LGSFSGAESQTIPETFEKSVANYTLPPALQPQPQPATNIFMCHECFILLK
jgi:hypothetical protein